MTVMITELYDALKDAGATEEKARKAAEILADYDSRLAAIDAKLSVALWAGGILFAVVLTSQALIWTAQGRIDGQLAAMATTLAHVEQLVAKP